MTQNRPLTISILGWFWLVVGCLNILAFGGVALFVVAGGQGADVQPAEPPAQMSSAIPLTFIAPLFFASLVGMTISGFLLLRMKRLGVWLAFASAFLILIWSAYLSTSAFSDISFAEQAVSSTLFATIFFVVFYLLVLRHWSQLR